MVDRLIVYFCAAGTDWRVFTFTRRAKGNTSEKGIVHPLTRANDPLFGLDAHNRLHADRREGA
jgi:hypothetical protein